MYAGFWLRLKAFAVDYLLIFGYLLLVMIVSLFLIPSLEELFQASRPIAQLTGFLLVTFPVSLYFILTKNKQSLYDRLAKSQMVKSNFS
ncbi:hypothetical protein ACRC6Q_17190 [Planococcus sp. SE5232]|uniref:hypothetical protein n=1 Tax=unclassified Planococcus (in: firmicutes) TaxID=2662419 RepID=UPI001CBC0E0D|nr:hypothetical protein [Planococcus sp. 4-30]